MMAAQDTPLNEWLNQHHNYNVIFSSTTSLPYFHHQHGHLFAQWNQRFLGIWNQQYRCNHLKIHSKISLPVSSKV